MTTDPQDPSAEDTDVDLVEVEVDGVDEDGDIVVDDVIAAVDNEGNVIATDEIVTVVTPDGDVVVDETISVVGGDGELHPFVQDIAVVEPVDGA
jgi:hypothetical protein